MIGFLILLATAVFSFAAGYATREFVSRKRHAEYLKFKPYLPPRPQRPPDFLLRRNAVAPVSSPTRTSGRHYPA